MIFWHEEDNYLIEGKRNGKAQKADICWNYKRHISPVRFLLWRKMVAVHWPLALRLVGRQAWQEKFQVMAIFKKFNIRMTVSVFLFF